MTSETRLIKIVDVTLGLFHKLLKKHEINDNLEISYVLSIFVAEVLATHAVKNGRSKMSEKEMVSFFNDFMGRLPPCIDHVFKQAMESNAGIH